MKWKVDSHTHTLASAHAYSTILENAQAAAKQDLELLCITDHAPALPDSPDRFHFMNYNVLDRELFGVQMLYGVELNILDREGNIDLPEDLLKRQDIVIASYHTVCTPAGSKAENTRAYLKAMENPYVQIIGHPEDGYIPVDFEELVLAAKENKVLLEVNNNSLKNAYFRLNTRENLMEILGLCEKHGVEISTGTDAHFATAVGYFDKVTDLLEEIHFPEELIANTDADKFLRLIHRKGGCR